METQWPLVIFTLFVCLTCGTLGGMSILALKGQGRNLQMTALITSAVSLVVGGIGAFLHLEHWERIFNGFGHITSGITQELIGCVALAIVIVAWFVVLRGGKPVPKALAWATLAVAVLMMVATAHSYLMPARPAWGLALVAFYLGNACLLGAAAVWLISILKKDEAVEATGIQLTFIAALVQMVEIMLKKLSPSLYQALGIFLPLITTNCAVLGVAILMIQKEFNLLQSVTYSVATALGFALALVLFAGIRERLDFEDVPKAFKGIPIALITAGILAMAFMGFSGLV